MSTNVTSGGFPHLYRMDVPGSFVDASAVRSVANADVAELHAALTPEIEIDDYGHLINVATKRALTATEFKQMFYARGDDEFSIANVYDCPNVGSNILASVWGKRIAPRTAQRVRVNTAGGIVLDPVNDIGEQLIFHDGVDAATMVMLSIIEVSALIFDIIVIHFAGVPLVSTLTSLLWWNGSVSGSMLSLQPDPVVFPSQTLPYNASRIMNYNKLSSRPDDPSGVDLAYGYANDLQRNFYASHEVMGNLENDLCVKKENWTLCSRIAIEDQLHNLSFTAEDTDDVCMKVSCARKWSEVEDALAESCLAENNIIGLGDYVDLYINVRVTNGNPQTKDTIIRIRFTVQMTRGPDDLGNWNVVSRNAASAMLTTGIPYDGPEGGNLQYANAAQTEVLGLYANQERTQAPDTTVPGNLDTMVDPHDHATNDGTGTSAAP